MLKSEIKIGRTGVQNYRTGETFGFINPDDIEIIEQIGQGSCGSIYKAIHVPTSTIVAIKSINIYDSEKRHQLANELLTLNQAETSNFLIHFFGAYFEEGYVKIVLEYMDCGSL